MPSKFPARTAIRLIVSMTALAGALACSNSADHESTPTDLGPHVYQGAFSVALWGFLDGASVGPGGPAAKPKYVYASGQVYDNPYPERLVETELEVPADATPGCAVYRLDPPDCSSIGGCGAASQDAVCAASAKTSPCICTAQDHCEPFPAAVDLGKLTVTGVETTAGTKAFELENLSNSYYLSDAVGLVYPGFAEGDTLTVSASGGTIPGFELSGKGIPALNLSTDKYALVRDQSTSDVSRYAALNLQWEPPTVAGESRIHVEIDLSRHAGTIGYLGCDVEDNGSLTISPGLISQIVGLGNIGGFAELVVERVASSATELTDLEGEISFEVTSADEFVVDVEGYTSCEQDSDCPTGQTCNRSIKLCR